MQKKVLLPLAVVIVLGIGVVGYVLVQKGKTPVSQESKVAQNEKVSTTESAWDQLWSVYTSPQGISLKYPKQIGAPGCDGKGHDPFVAMKILEDKAKGVIYTGPEYYYDYPTINGGSPDDTKPCQKIVNSPDQIIGLGGLTINVRDVKNKEELNKFIQDIYGSGCKIKDPGVYKDAEGNVTSLDEMGGGNYKYELNAYEDANGNPTDLGTTVCQVEGPYKIMYNKARNKAVAMYLGQDCTIDNGNHDIGQSAGYECYTTEIADSIIFN